MYKIHVLRDEEFDNLPGTVTRGSDVSGSLGFADPVTGRAYVRYTQSHDLNKFLINHELEELMADSSMHEDENGIRHKRGLFNMSDKKQQNAQRDAELEAQRQAEAQQRQQNMLIQSLMGQTKAGPLGQFSVDAPSDQGGAGVGNVAGKLGSPINQTLGNAGGYSAELIKQLMSGQPSGRSYYF